MDQQQFLEAVRSVRAATQKRNFAQTFDIIINLKDIDLKNENERIFTFLRLPHSRGKKICVTALVGKELAVKAKEVCNAVVQKEEFPTADKKFIKQLAAKTDFFIAQANVMPDIAKTFGRILGTRGLMPNPKAGCVLTPNDDVKALIAKLQHTVRLETKNEPTVKTIVGSEAMKDEEVAENAFTVYNTVLHALPQEEHSIKSVLIKLTMSKPFFVSGKGELQQATAKPQHPVEKEKELKKEMPAPQQKKESAKEKEKQPVKKQERKKT